MMTGTSAARIALLGICISLGGCRQDTAAPDATTELVLYCGAGLRPVAEKLIEAFEEEHNVRIAATYAGSGRLLGQMTASRSGDLFMPGADFYVEKALELGLADAATQRTVTYFIPVLLVGKGNPLKINGVSDLATRNIRIGLGDERGVAVGVQAAKVFEKNAIPIDAVQQRTVLRSATVNELAVAVEMGHVDAAIVWEATARQFAHTTDFIPIAPEHNVIAVVPIVRLTTSRHKQTALAFIDFLLSPTGKRIFQDEGYTVTETE